MNKMLYKRLRFLKVILRTRYAFSYYKKPLKSILKWAVADTENHNFLYPLTSLNMQYLMHFLSNSFDVSYETVQVYLDEILNDDILTKDLLNRMRLNRSPKDTFPYFGRRLGWYVIARILKPKIIFESGVFEGLGAIALISALKRNSIEGFPGKYIGTDITMGSGGLLSKIDHEFGKIIISDTALVINGLSEKIDLFISDGDHSSEFEWNELNALSNKLSQKSYVLSDNSHTSGVLAEWSVQNNRKFLFFKEEPDGHWYPGAGIGISIKDE